MMCGAREHGGQSCVSSLAARAPTRSASLLHCSALLLASQAPLTRQHWANLGFSRQSTNLMRRAFAPEVDGHRVGVLPALLLCLHLVDQVRISNDHNHRLSAAAYRARAACSLICSAPTLTLARCGAPRRSR